MSNLDVLYKKLSTDEQNVVEKSLSNSTLLNKLYKLLCLKEIPQTLKQGFLEKNGLTDKSFNYLISHFILHMASDHQKRRIQFYNHYRKIRDPKCYQKIIQKILDEQDLVEKKKLLKEYREIYGVNVNNFGNETNQRAKIKETNILYQQMIDEIKKRKKSSVMEETRLKGLANIKEKFLEVEQKINRKEYHLQKELKELQNIIYKERRVLTKEEIELFNSNVLKYYDCILNCVVSLYDADPVSFNVLTYYYITDVEPHYLLKKTTDSDLSLYGKLLKKTTPAHSNSFNAVFVSNINVNYFQNIEKYQYQGVTLDRNDLLELYDQMDDYLPKNEYVFMEFVRDYIRKNKDLLLNEKKLIK